MIFGTFNGLAFIHMFLTAPETKGIYTPPPDGRMTLTGNRENSRGNGCGF